MPEQSIPKEAAYQIINDELMLDGNPRLNLASFVTTWMEPECDKLIQASVNKNYVDMDEYPVTTELQVRSPRRSCFILAPSIAHQSSRSYQGLVSGHDSVVSSLIPKPECPKSANQIHPFPHFPLPAWSPFFNWFFAIEQWSTQGSWFFIGPLGF
jgi:hypothetical protein